MQIEVTVSQHNIEADCSVDIQNSRYIFSLASGFRVSAITNNGQPVSDIRKEDCFMQFRPAMTKYTVEGLEAGSLKICYAGVPSGNFAFMTDAFIHFSYYNGWYPVGYDAGNTYEIALLVDDDYEVLHAEFDAKNKKWLYIEKDDAFPDCNIICMHKAMTSSIKSDDISIYWFDKDKTETAETLYRYYGEICRFYRDLYRNNKISHTDIVMTPGNYRMGAYMRKDLIVFSEMDPDTDFIHVLAHEIGHAYAAGADTASYHDWLNETHAEWSALLYLEKFRPKLFKDLTEKMEAESGGSDNRLCLRECGDRRPDNVHRTGTLIYYRIYKEYGSEVIAELLRIFDLLEKKDTDGFLEQVSEYNGDVADLIKLYL